VPVVFFVAARERAEAFDRAAVLGEEEDPLRALAVVCALVEVFDFDGALLLTLP